MVHGEIRGTSQFRKHAVERRTATGSNGKYQPCRRWFSDRHVKLYILCCGCWANLGKDVEDCRFDDAGSLASEMLRISE